jgi:hypothetical protein
VLLAHVRWRHCAANPGDSAGVSAAWRSYATGDLTLHRCRFVQDVAVSGSGHLDLTATTLSARVRLAGTSKARLRIKPRGSTVVLTGGPDRRPVRLLVLVHN